MLAHTVVVLKAYVGFETCEEFTAAAGLPVVGFYAVDGGHSGGGESNVDTEDASAVADSLDSLLRMVDAADVPSENAISWATEQVEELEKLLKASRAAFRAKDEAAALNAAYRLRELTQRYSAGWMAYEAR